MRTLITFDISCDRARYRVARHLEDEARRVQKSVFEAPHLSRQQYLRLRSNLEGRIDPETDSLRYYRLCAACAARVEHTGGGIGLLTTPPRFVIIE